MQAEEQQQQHAGSGTEDPHHSHSTMSTGIARQHHNGGDERASAELTRLCEQTFFIRNSNKASKIG